MNTNEIRQRWRDKLQRTGATKLSVNAESLKALLAEVDPESFAGLRQQLAERPQATILLPPSQLQLLVDYEPERKDDADEPSDVRGRAEAHLDDQSDDGAD